MLRREPWIFPFLLLLFFLFQVERSHHHWRGAWYLIKARLFSHHSMNATENLVGYFDARSSLCFLYHSGSVRLSLFPRLWWWRGMSWRSRMFSALLSYHSIPGDGSEGSCCKYPIFHESKKSDRANNRWAETQKEYYTRRCNAMARQRVLFVPPIFRRHSGSGLSPMNLLPMAVIIPPIVRSTRFKGPNGFTLIGPISCAWILQHLLGIFLILYFLRTKTFCQRRKWYSQGNGILIQPKINDKDTPEVGNFQQVT